MDIAGVGIHNDFGRWTQDDAQHGLPQKVFSTAQNSGASDSDLYLHETMFQWEGWSLSATRPGKTIIAESYDSNGNPLPQQNEKVAYSPNSAKGIDGVNIETSFGPQPGTLPRLRFGHKYRMRVRAADIAGTQFIRVRLVLFRGSYLLIAVCCLLFAPLSSQTSC